MEINVNYVSYKKIDVSTNVYLNRSTKMKWNTILISAGRRMHDEESETSQATLQIKKCQVKVNVDELNAFYARFDDKIVIRVYPENSHIDYTDKKMCVSSSEL